MSRVVNGGGQGGKTWEDKKLAGEVRQFCLREIKRALEGKYDEEFKKAVILRLAGSILPRLNEHSGPEGKPIPLLNVLFESNN